MRGARCVRPRPSPAPFLFCISGSLFEFCLLAVLTHPQRVRRPSEALSAGPTPSLLPATDSEIALKQYTSILGIPVSFVLSPRSIPSVARLDEMDPHHATGGLAPRTFYHPSALCSILLTLPSDCAILSARSVKTFAEAGPPSFCRPRVGAVPAVGAVKLSLSGYQRLAAWGNNCSACKQHFHTEVKGGRARGETI